MSLSGFVTPSSRAQTPLSENYPVETQCTLDISGILSDMDGTLIDSTTAIVKHWERVGALYGIDPRQILATSHGRRSIDVFQTIDPSRATWDFVCGLEAEVPVRFGGDAVEIAGARALLDSLQALGAKWAIVTSGTRPLVAGWLEVLQLVQPEHMVTAEDVVRGKPDPECYRLGAKKLGLELGNCSRSLAPVLVLEDAPAGVRAGKAAGCRVLALATTHRPSELKEAGADWVIPDLKSLGVDRSKSRACGLSVTISNIMV